jgi:hypothetical protein
MPPHLHTATVEYDGTDHTPSGVFSAQLSLDIPTLIGRMPPVHGRVNANKLCDLRVEGGL